MTTILAISRRELNAYFSTPLAYVFIVIFLALAGATTFYFGGFFPARSGRLGSVLLVSSLAVSVFDPRCRHEIVGRRTEIRDYRTFDDVARVDD